VSARSIAQILLWFVITVVIANIGFCILIILLQKRPDYQSQALVRQINFNSDAGSLRTLTWQLIALIATLITFCNMLAGAINL
jgi:hypothetical protein